MQNNHFREPAQRAFFAAFLLLPWLLGGCGGGSSTPAGTPVASALVGRYVSTTLTVGADTPTPTFTVSQSGRVEATLLLNGVTYRAVSSVTNNGIIYNADDSVANNHAAFVEFEFKLDADYLGYSGTFASTNNTVQVTGGHTDQPACTKDNPPCSMNASVGYWAAQKQ